MANSTAGSRPRSKVEIRILSSRSYRRLGVLPVFCGECSANRTGRNGGGRPSGGASRHAGTQTWPVHDSQAQERPHGDELAFELAREPGIPWRASCDIAEPGLQHAARNGKVRPADDLVTPQQRQRVIAELAQPRRRIGLEAIRPVPEEL